MRDQAENLRNVLKTHHTRHLAKTIAVISGKGGVGKSNFSLNFSISLAQQRKRVLLFDMDIGMGNIEIMMGKYSDRNMMDFFSGHYSLKELITSGPSGISVISGGSGLATLFSLNESMFSMFTKDFQLLLEQFDFIIFDMGAGINEDSAKFLLCVDELVVVTTPEPTAIMDAYSVMKYLHSVNSALPFYLICNRIVDIEQGKSTMDRLQKAMEKFLQKEIIRLGYLPDDRTVSRSVTKQVPFLLYDPKADVSKSLDHITNRYLNHSFSDEWTIKRDFLGNLKRHFLRK
jgi:flagellar biosynthesis protein FlhG